MLRAITAGLIFSLVAALPAHAQTSCTVTARSTLLTQLSDNAAAGSITPQIIRNLLCTSAPGLAAIGDAQTVVTSPTSFTATAPGKVVVSAGMVEISGNAGGVWTTVGLMGGVVPVVKNDIVRVTWFGEGADAIPDITWFPGQ